MASIQDRGKEFDRRWQARYRDPSGRQKSRSFRRKIDARRWLDEVTADVMTGKYVDPSTRNVSVGEWCDTWLAGYQRRPSTVRQAEVHLKLIRAEFESVPLASVRPSQIKEWLNRLSDDGYAASTLYALHARLSQLMADAVHDRLIAENPCSRRTSPGVGSQRPYVATTDQVWDLYDSLPERRRLAVLLGAFAGLTTGEVCGLRVSDVAFLEREIRPAVQYLAAPLKTAMRATSIPVSDSLIEAMSVQVERWPSKWLLSGPDGAQVGPWNIDRAVRRARGRIGLPTGFRFHDLRHFYASLLIASGADVKVVQHRLRHASAKTTLDTYSHLWPDSDESTRTAVEKVLSQRLVESSLNRKASE